MLASFFNRLLHWDGSQLASEQWSSPQSIQFRSHCFSQPEVHTLEALAESITSVPVAGSPIKLQSSIKHLGVHGDFDKEFSEHVMHLIFTSVHYITIVLHHWGLQDGECRDSRIETWLYCNSVLAGTSVSNLTRLQLLQNTLAWVVTQKSRLIELH